jgi:cytidylate kinase
MMGAITISRQFGSGGDEIAMELCHTMSCHLFDKRMIAQAAVEAGISDQEVVDYNEDNHKVQNFFDRLLGRSTPLGTLRYWTEDAQGVRVQEMMPMTEEHALTLVQKAVISAYRSGHVVVIGRAGQILLKDLPDVLHLRIEAPIEDRIQRIKMRLKEERGMPFDTIETRRVAQDMINERDAASQDYLQRHYGVDWADPLLYHLTINTGKITIENAVKLITHLVEMSGMLKAESIKA